MIFNTPEELRREVFSGFFAVYDIFKEHFGEEYVDAQDVHSANDLITPDIRPCIDISEESLTSIKEIWGSECAYILVYWPVVTITNEYDRSTVIQDLYAKVKVQMNGMIPYEYSGFMLNRATYPMIQYNSDYAHSHLPGINYRDPSEFRTPCMGTGPICHTIISLKREFDETFWMLFCQELSMYVTVESIQGVPYRRLENIGNHGRALRDNYSILEYSTAYDRFVSKLTKPVAKEFISYYLTNGHLKLDYANNNYIPGISFQQFLLDLSNCFIDYYNHLTVRRYSVDDLKYHELLKDCLYSQGRFYNPGNQGQTSDTLSGHFVCRFKGRDVFGRVISDDTQEEVHSVLVLHSDIALVILNKILRTINYRFKNETTSNSGRDSQANTGEATSQTSEAVLYI